MPRQYTGQASGRRQGAHRLERICHSDLGRGIAFTAGVIAPHLTVGLALPDREERDAARHWLRAGDIHADSLIEAGVAEPKVVGRGFGCIVADGDLLRSGYLATLRAQVTRTPIVAVVHHGQEHDPAFRRTRLSTVLRPLDARSLTLAVSLAHGEGQQPRSRTRTRTPRVPSRISGSPAVILDISPGGMRLELSQAHAAKLGPQFRLQVPMVALDVVLRRAWVLSTGDGRVQCGAMLEGADARQRMAWERIAELSSSAMSLPGMSRHDVGDDLAAARPLLGRVSQILTTPISLPAWASLRRA